MRFVSSVKKVGLLSTPGRVVEVLAGIAVAIMRNVILMKELAKKGHCKSALLKKFDFFLKFAKVEIH